MGNKYKVEQVLDGTRGTDPLENTKWSTFKNYYIRSKYKVEHYSFVFETEGTDP